MPIFQVYDEETKLLAAAAYGMVSEENLDASRISAARIYTDRLPDAIYLDLLRVESYPDFPGVYARCVKTVTQLDIQYGAIQRPGNLIVRADVGSLGYGIGRVYHSQDALHDWVNIQLFESRRDVADALHTIWQPHGPEQVKRRAERLANLFETIENVAAPVTLSRVATA